MSERGHRPERRSKNDGRPLAPGPRATAAATSTSVWGQDTVGNAMPVACRDREKALPDARWRARIRRAQGGAQRQLQAGRYTADTIASRRWLRDKTREVRALTKMLRD